MGTSSLRRLFIAALVLSVGGWVGLEIAIRVYPESNLLGGWGLILGPVYWVGLILLLIAVVWWLISIVRNKLK